jgi:imidazolonepropionase-like amidohydrolase
MRVFLLAFFCLSQCIWAQSKVEPSSQTLVFTNVNIVDTRDGRILSDMTVVVRGSRIQGVARVGLIANDHNVHMINAAGKYMIPGLWDMDVHTASPSAPSRQKRQKHWEPGIYGLEEVGWQGWLTVPLISFAAASSRSFCSYGTSSLSSSRLSKLNAAQPRIVWRVRAAFVRSTSL